MNMIGFILLSLGCIIVVGAVIGLAWEMSHVSAGDPLTDSVVMTNEIKEFHRKYKPYLLSPIGLALLLYLISFVPLLIMPALKVEFGMVFLFAIIIAFTVFSVISPIINLFLPRWWLNTVLYVVSWFLLFYALLGTLSWRAGDDMSVAAIGFGPAMVLAVFVLPITAVIKLVMSISGRSQKRL